MVFSSQIFVFYFLPSALLVYYVLPRRGKHAALTLLSYTFYGWANPLFVVLMLSSTLVDYLCGLAMAQEPGTQHDGRGAALPQGTQRTGRQRIALWVSVGANLSLLGFFKYFNFAAGSYDALLSALGLGELRLDLWFRIALPLGISFYTFQSMSYTIDVYRGDARPIRNFVDFACYVSMFPQLVAGPIVRFSDVDDQLAGRTHTWEKFARGVAFFCLGMSKKILLANPCGKIADSAFDAAATTALDAWYGVTAYALQIYYDFSGYSDMAIGLGLMLGFVFAKNFDSPYRSASVTEFWRRWHLSLSTWLRDYLYIPLGGNRHGTVRTYGNVAIVMLLGGLWHGASWNFILWGALHALLLSAERLAGRRTLYRRLPRPVAVAVTFVLVLVTWVFFRAPDLPAALAYLRAMFGAAAGSTTAGLLQGIMWRPYYLVSFLVAATLVWTAPQTWDFTRRIGWPKAAYVLGVFALALVVLSTQSYNPFIYFIF